MKITTNHPTSSYGIPVVLDDDGQPMDYADGIAAIRRTLGAKTKLAGRELIAAACGVSRRTVEGWEQKKHAPPASALLTLGKMLAKRRRTAKEPK